MNNTNTFLAIIIMSAVTVAIRFAPFVIFSNGKTPRIIEQLGKVLPFAVMGMLVVYCLKSITFTSGISGFLPEIIAGAVVVFSYIWKKNTLISIIGGTVCYMVMIQFIFV